MRSIRLNKNEKIAQKATVQVRTVYSIILELIIHDRNILIKEARISFFHSSIDFVILFVS